MSGEPAPRLYAVLRPDSSLSRAFTSGRQADALAVRLNQRASWERRIAGYRLEIYERLTSRGAEGKIFPRSK